MENWARGLCQSDPVQSDHFLRDSPFDITAQCDFKGPPPTNAAALTAQADPADLITGRIPVASQVRSLRLQLVNAKRQSEDGLKAVSNSLLMLENWEDGHHQRVPSPKVKPTKQIMRERRGRGLPSKIDRDPELRSFIRSHTYSLSYADIVDLMAKRFPKERRTSKSAISRWWTKQQSQTTSSDRPYSPTIVKNHEIPVKGFTPE